MNALVERLQSGTIQESPESDATVCVVVTYNSEDYIYDCLAALEQNDVVVVDNDSVDRTRAIVSDFFPSIRLLHVRRNVGLARAFNLGWQAVGHENVVLLNPDVIADVPGISQLVNISRSSAVPAIVGPGLTNNDGSMQASARTFPTLAANLARRTPLGRTSWGRSLIKEHLTSASSNHREPIFSDWVLGAALVIPREILVRLGGYDDRYFLYCEDVDFCARAWDCGYPVLYCPHVTFAHAYQRQSRRSWDFRSRATRAHLASTIRLASKFPYEYLGMRPIRDKGRLTQAAR